MPGKDQTAQRSAQHQAREGATALRSGDAAGVTAHLRKIADQHLSSAPREVQDFLDNLVKVLDPDWKDKAWRLEFRRNRAGNSEDVQALEFRNFLISHDANTLYHAYRKEGEPVRGLRKKVIGDIVRIYRRDKLKDSTVAQLWRRARHASKGIASREPGSNRLMDRQFRFEVRGGKRYLIGV